MGDLLLSNVAKTAEEWEEKTGVFLKALGVCVSLDSKVQFDKGRGAEATGTKTTDTRADARSKVQKFPFWKFLAVERIA